MDKAESLLWEYQKAIQGIYKEQALNCLAGLDGKYIHNEKQFYGWYHDVIRKCSVHYKLGNIYHMKIMDDLSFCSMELLYFTACLYLYRPYINNPLNQAFYLNSQMIYPNYQNHYGVRYDMFADTASQKAYNYWDRVGDLIASFFPEKLKATNIYFASALEIIPSEYQSNPNYKWLNDFKAVGYKELNAKRKQVVHYSTSNTDFRYEHLDNVVNRENVKQLQNERESLADFYKDQIRLSLEGFEKTLLLLEYISEDLFIDVQ